MLHSNRLNFGRHWVHSHILVPEKGLVMKCLFLVLFPFAFASAQVPGVPGTTITGGAGVTWIDNQPFYSVRLQPEFPLGAVAVGLDLNLEFDAEGKLRKENFNEFSDYASVIRYVRYGTEQDDWFVKLGALDYATIGLGNIVNNYNNSPSVDSRRIGLQVNGRFGPWGFQSVYGNFGQAGVAALRGDIRPVELAGGGDIPLLGGLELGGTWAADFDPYARVSSILLTPFSRPPARTLAGVLSVSPGDTIGGLTVDHDGALHFLGADLTLPVVRGDFAGLEVYGDATKILDYGSGYAAGVVVHVDGIPFVTVRARGERRWNGERYLPSYFGPFYELERFSAVARTAKSRSLSTAASTRGVYGDLLARVLNSLTIFGSFEKLDGVDHSGILHLVTDLSPADLSFIARASYDKAGILDFQDLVTTDDRSVLTAEIGYRPYPFMIVSAVYRWTYTPLRSGGEITGYRPQRRVEPRISFIYTM